MAGGAEEAAAGSGTLTPSYSNPRLKSPIESSFKRKNLYSFSVAFYKSTRLIQHHFRNRIILIVEKEKDELLFNDLYAKVY